MDSADYFEKKLRDCQRKIKEALELCDAHDAEWASSGDKADCECPLPREIRATLS